MVIRKARNKAGWMKLSYRKRYYFFGEKMYFVVGRTYGKRTHIAYRNFEPAKGLFEALYRMTLEK